MSRKWNACGFPNTKTRYFGRQCKQTRPHTHTHTNRWPSLTDSNNEHYKVFLNHMTLPQWYVSMLSHTIYHILLLKFCIHFSFLPQSHTSHPARPSLFDHSFGKQQTQFVPMRLLNMHFYTANCSSLPYINKMLLLLRTPFSKLLNVCFLITFIQNNR